MITFDSLPLVEPDEATEDQLADFMEDLFQAVRRDGSILDVGWYPNARRDGEFRCRVVECAEPEAWDDPIEDFRTRSLGAVRHWVRERL